MQADDRINFVLDPKNNNKDTDGMLHILKAHFDKDIKEVEQYLGAILSTMISDAYNSVKVKKGKRRPSKKQVKKIKGIILTKIRSKYGKYFDLQDFSFKDRRGGFKFSTNLRSSFRHKKGVLYGHPQGSYLRPLFYTTHSLDRFSERVDPEKYEAISTVYKKKHSSQPTVLNILDLLTSRSLSWGYDNVCYYINVLYGALVIEIHKGVLIVKTFLTPDMLHDGIEWRSPDYIDIDGEKTLHIKDIGDLFNHKNEAIDPAFFDDSEEARVSIEYLAHIIEKKSRF